MKTPTNKDNLDQLFNKANADKQNLDDFEKEAMAGFDMLDSEKEAIDLKTSLDARINKELFYKKESHNPKVYWLAAAGLALVIGLSILFVLNNTNSISKNNDLAITDTKTLNSPIFGGELKEDVNAADQTITPSEKAPAKEIEEKEVLNKKRLLDAEGVKGGNEISTEISQVSSADQEQSEVANSEKVTSTKKEINTKLGEGINARSSRNESLDDLAKTGSKDKESDSYKLQTAASAPVQSPKLAEVEKTVKDEAAGSVFKQKNKRDDANIDGDLKKGPEVASNTISNKAISRQENRAKEKAKKASVTKGNAGMPESEINDNKPGATKALDAEETKAIPAEDKRDEKDFINCFYPGGESAITKDIKEKLIKENLNQKFDVTLYVNEKKVVEKVEFINSYDLTKTQKETLTKILKSLNKFDFFMVPTKKSTFPYKVLYRP